MLRVVQSSRDKREKDSNLLVGSFRNFKELGENLDSLGTIGVLQGFSQRNGDHIKLTNLSASSLEDFPQSLEDTVSGKVKSLSSLADGHELVVLTLTRGSNSGLLRLRGSRGGVSLFISSGVRFGVLHQH